MIGFYETRRIEELINQLSEETNIELKILIDNVRKKTTTEIDLRLSPLCLINFVN